MGWFRRSRGRHALGAPKRVADPAVVVPAFVPVPVASNLSFFPPVGSAEGTPAPVVAHLSEPAVPVRVESTPPPTHLAEPTPAVDTDDLLGSIAALIVSGEAWVESPGVPVQRAAPVAPHPMTFAPDPVRMSLLPAIVEAAEPSVAQPTPAAPSRISLGFRDGTTASLDPGSEQAAALEELALLLSLRD